MSEPFEEIIHGIDMDYTQRWLCDVPPDGASFQVLDQEWNDDYTLRTIKRIRLATEGT